MKNRRLPSLAATPVLSPGIARATGWVGLGAVARSRGLLCGWDLARSRGPGGSGGARDSQLFLGYIITGMFSEIHLDMFTTEEHLYKIRIKKTSAVRSRISSQLIFASCVGYFDRAYYGFYVTSSRMLFNTW